MAFLVLPIVSLILYIIGFVSPLLVIYMAALGFVLAVFSYVRCQKSSEKDLFLTIGKFFSLALVVVGAVFLVSIVLSQFLLGPILSSII